MNHAYSRAHTPVLRNPGLFHQSTRSYSGSTAKYFSNLRSTNQYLLAPGLNKPPSQYIAPTPSPYPVQAYPPVLTLPRSPSLAQFSYPSYPVPVVTYTSTVSSKGLSIILIAILILVAMDLVMVRPQKARFKVQSSLSEVWPISLANL